MIQMVSNESESQTLIWGYQDKRKANKLSYDSINWWCTQGNGSIISLKESREKYLNGILLFFVLMSICTGGFYRSPCPTDKPRKKSSICRKRNVKLWLHVSLLACSLCLEMDRILNDQLQLQKLTVFESMHTAMVCLHSWSHLSEFPLLSMAHE